MPRDSPVLLFDGTRKPRQDVHAAVIDIDVGRRDLQQCADAVMRLRAEYLFAAGRFDEIRFHPQPGKPNLIDWTGGARRDGWDRFLVRLFAAAGSASLDAELPHAHGAPLPGDVLIQGGYPGHAVVVLDVAADPSGRHYLLLGQLHARAADPRAEEPRRPAPVALVRRRRAERSRRRDPGVAPVQIEGLAAVRP